MMLKKIFLYSLILSVVLNIAFLQNACAYLDPGTGSYVYQVLVASLIGGVFTIKMFWKKITTFLRINSSENKNEE